jgi:phosphonate transport system substrate-binding protein
MNPLRFVTFLAPNVLPAYRGIAHYISQQLRHPVDFLVADSHAEFTQLAPDVAFICGLPYILMRRQPLPPVELLAAPVLQGARYQDRPIYFSDVIVHTGSPYQSFADLRGASWAYNEQVSQSGYGITRHHLMQMGETNGFFGRVVNAGWHQKAIEMVIERTIDATAIDSQVLAIALRDNPSLQQHLRIIDVLGPSTIQPVVNRPTLNPALRADLQHLFLTLHQTPVGQSILDQGLFARFTAVQDSDYDDLRQMLSAAEAADFLVIC